MASEAKPGTQKEKEEEETLERSLFFTVVSIRATKKSVRTHGSVGEKDQPHVGRAIEINGSHVT